MTELVLWTEGQHLRRVGYPREERSGGAIDADVGRLRGQRHRHQQLVGIAVDEFGPRRGIGGREPTIERGHVVWLHA